MTAALPPMAGCPAPTAPMMEWALFYTGKMIWRIFPCVPGKKTPITEHGLKEATTDQRQIREWWQRWPNANIAMATGKPSGVWVLDVDLKEIRNRETGEITVIDGFKTLAALEAANGPLPATVTQRTGGGGQQMFFPMPLDGTDIVNSAGKLGPGLDVRGTGGYVILPPSVHPDPPRARYVWPR